MAVGVGTRIGAYEITAAIGRGGMGEVFRARDTRLHRDVAVKVLPETLADDPERLARFEREAQVLASLNHPNIAHVYGVEESTGDSAGRAGARTQRALVMELVDGEDLASRIARGAVPLEEAIAIAVQIAHALEAAHDQGIVHRDLKPANIRLRADGTVKVLDFGLAKALERTHDRLSAAHATITSPATMQGVVLGTAAYMSPEQARGRAIDRRSDIWAFGVVLYEMLTGRAMFAADTVSDTIAAVLTRETPLDTLPPATPPAVRRVLQRCLQKDPARRLHHIADARIELEHAASEPQAPDVTVRAAASRVRWPPAIAGGLIAAAVSGAIVWGLLSRPGPRPVRYSLTVADAGFSTVSYSAISPDGKWIAYSPNRHSGPFPLLLRPLDGFEAREITAGPTTGFNPFFSADGRWLAFRNGTVLFRVPVTGGTPERLGTVLAGVTDGAWGDDNTILLSANFRVDNVIRRALTRLLPNGSFEGITRPAAGEAHQDVHILPGSKTVMFTVATPKSWAIAVAPLPAGGTPRVILDDARRPRYAAGRLFFQRASSGDLMAVPFNPDRLSTSGEPTRIASVAHVVDSPGFDVSHNGTLIYSGPNDTTAQAGFTAVLVNRSGTESTVVAQTGSWSEPRVSPDGRTLILRDIVSPNCVLWSVDLQRGTRTRVSFDGDNHNPVWRADGQLTWGSAVEGTRGIVMGRVDRPNVSITQLAPGEHERVPESWSPTSELLAFTEIHPDTDQDVWLLDTKSGAARPFANSSYKENQARFSRDGRWLAYVSNESGRDEVYVQPVDGNGARLQVSVEGGSSPLWSPDGKALFYVEKASQLMGVTIDFRPARPEIGRPQQILQGRYVWDRTGNYDITPDGQQFVFIRRTDASDPSATLRVLINWF